MIEEDKGFWFSCPGCRRRLRAQVHAIGAQVRCPGETCRQVITVPTPASVENAVKIEQDAPSQPTAFRKPRRKWLLALPILAVAGAAILLVYVNPWREPTLDEQMAAFAG